MSAVILYPASGGVPVYTNLAAFPASATTGSLGVAANTGNLYEFNGSAWQQIGGPSGALSLGALDGQAATATGAALVSGVLYMQSADATHPGLVNNTTQSFSGNKTFTGTIGASNLSGTNTGDVTLSTANGLSLSGQALSLQAADTTHTGALTSTDWNTFNGKQAALTIGNLTAVGTDGIAITSGTGAVIGSGTSIAQHVADTTHNGYLTSTDWNTFNGKQASGNYITALTGDGTASGPGSAALTLATVNANVGSFTNASVTVDGKGRITAASSGTAPVTAVSVASANGFAGSSSGGATPALTLTTSITGILKGNGTAISAATAGTDYSAGTNALATGILKSTTTTGALTIAVAGDFPTLNQNTSGSAASLSATLVVGSGGTGQTTYTDGQLLIGNSSGNTLSKATLTAGSNITITNGNGTISIAASGGSSPTTASYTPTFAGIGTATNVSVFTWTIGDRVYVSGSAATGTVTGAAISITIPAGKAIDYTKLATTATSQVGRMQRLVSGATIASSSGPWVIFTDGSDTGKVYVCSTLGSNVYAKDNGNSRFNSTDWFSFDFNVPFS